MKKTKNRRLLAALMLLALIGTLLPMSAAATSFPDWHAPYLQTLKLLTGRRAVTLCDITRDGIPEMATLSANSAGLSTLKIYSLNGTDSVELPLGSDAFTFQGVKSVNSYLFQNSSGNVCLLLSIKSASGGKTMSHKIGLTKSTNGSLKPLYIAQQSKSGGKTRYYVNCEEVSRTKYASEKASFERAYKNKGALPLKTLDKNFGSSDIEARFSQLEKSFLSFSGVKSVKLSKSSATLEVGNKLTLDAALSPSSATATALTWTTSDDAVATVDENGLVTATGVGEANITATAPSGKKDSCKISVKGIAPTGIALNETLLTMTTNNLADLQATVKPANATTALTWSSSNGKVASVNDNGQVKALSKGKATITVTTSNKKKATCQIVVSDREAVIIDISQHEYSSKMDWKLISENVDLMILRCGVTRTETDPIGVGRDDRFPYYAEKCKQYGIPFGVYYYGKCTDKETAIEEAEMTWRVASPYNPLFYVYDVEESCLNRTLIETYMKKLKSLGAKKTGYYIAHHLYGNYSLDTKLVDFIWLPHYGKNTGAINSTPSFSCDLHQYTSVGRIPGIPTGVDVNRLMGEKSLAWFLKKV